MRRIIIAGNWKMNKNLNEAQELANEITQKAGNNTSIDIVLCPPYVYLEKINNLISTTNIKLGAQNMYFQKSGAFTGEISVDMLKSVGCQYVIIGHSERRQFFGETNESVNKKVKFALENELIPIVCVGESLQQRESNQTFNVIEDQLINGLKDLNDLILNKNKEIVIAYEPVWAIGTGKVATPEQAQEVHAFIREKLAKIFNAETAQKIRLQYGGSVTADNISNLITQKDIDGALIGGACLKADSFTTIINLSEKK